MSNDEATYRDLIAGRIRIECQEDYEYWQEWRKRYEANKTK